MFEWTIEYLADENILYLKSRGIMDNSSANGMVKALADTAVEYNCLTHLVDHRETIFALDTLDYFNRPAINQKLGVSRSFKILDRFHIDQWRFGAELLTLLSHQAFCMRQYRREIIIVQHGKWSIA